MYSNVIVGVDGHPHGRDAVALARALTGRRGRLTFAHVQAPELLATEAYRLAAAEQSDSHTLLELERDASGVDALLVSVPAHSVGRGLHEIAEARGADLLVVGSCRHGFLGRVLLGSDTQAAVDGSICAVAVAPVGYADRLDPIKVIGVGYDETGQGRAALALARQLAGEHDCAVRALRVVAVATSPYAACAGAAWGAALGDALARAQERMSALTGVDADAVLGLPGEELAAFSGGVDLLVIGSRGYGPIHRLMLGSTSQQLVGHARCPLLVLPRTEAAEARAAADGIGREQRTPLGAGA
jgi:nucleotide-binding universal stress UspA family protein